MAFNIPWTKTVGFSAARVESFSTLSNTTLSVLKESGEKVKKKKQWSPITTWTF